MLRSILPLFVVLFIPAWACLQTATVTFELEAPGLPDTTTVYLTGNRGQLGPWDPAKVPMQAQGDQRWSLEVELGTGLLEYKFTLGSWEREGARPNGKPMANLRAALSRDTTLRHLIEDWTGGEHLFKGQITGTLKYHRATSYPGIAERDVVVWLPPGYEDDPKRHYPVLYMHDGQNVFDPATSSYGVDWQVDETCTRLIKSRDMEPLIVVGIYNSPDRALDYSPGPKGSAYMAYLVKKLKPFIDKMYRTRPEREHTFTGGASMGGLISFMLVWEYPEVFSGAICMSPAFQYKTFDFVAPVRAYSGDLKPVRIYLDNGGVGLEKQLQPGLTEMYQALQKQGYRPGEDLLWVYAPGAEHFESAWAARMPVALKWLIPRQSR